jgi:acyl carrier protein
VKTIEIVLAVVRSVAKEHSGGTSEIGLDTNLLLEGDLDSLATLEILEALEKHFQVEVFSHLDLAEFNTPAKLAAWIDERK